MHRFHNSQYREQFIVIKIYIEKPYKENTQLVKYESNLVGFSLFYIMQNLVNSGEAKGLVGISTEMKETLTSLELVEQINLFRSQEGRTSKLAHSDLLKIIKDEFEDELREGKISYLFKTRKLANGGSKQDPYFELTLSQAKQVLVRESKFVRKHVIAYIEKLEKTISSIISDKDKMLLDIMKSNSEAEIAANIAKYEVAYVKPLELRADNAEKEVKHKKEVISYMTSDFKLQTQRQFLNEIIRMKGNENNLISERWKLLYSFYEKNNHINLAARFEAYNLTHKPKLKSKLQLIDEVLNDIPGLYRIAVKTFEADFKDKLQQYLSVL